VDNSRGKRSVPDIVDDPASGYDTHGYSTIVASTSTLVASSYTKRGTLQPLSLMPVALHGVSSCAIRSEACRDA
jgi:hypothetical protein